MANWLIEEYNKQVSGRANDNSENIINPESLIKLETTEALNVEDNKSTSQSGNQNALTTALKNAGLL